MLDFPDVERHIGPDISFYSRLSLYFSVLVDSVTSGPWVPKHLACLCTPKLCCAGPTKELSSS